jgi:hypothetical protein
MERCLAGEAVARDELLLAFSCGSERFSFGCLPALRAALLTTASPARQRSTGSAGQKREGGSPQTLAELAHNISLSIRLNASALRVSST